MLLTEILVTAYAFVVGACVGSFLNVVAWRVPLGMSLIRPASHCPQCKTPIRLRDNVPVLGWILLRGHCRACGCWISPRYPLVEFATGAAFALLAWFELATGGSNLPPRSDVWKPIAAGLPFDWLYLCVWLYHVTLISLLTTIALVEFDGRRLTRGFIAFALLAGLLPPLVLPQLHVTYSARMNASAWTAEFTLQQSLQYLTYGVVLGLCIAWAFDPRKRAQAQLIPLAAALGAVGMFLGDAAVYLVGCMVATGLLALRLLFTFGLKPFRRHSSSALVALSAVAAIVAFRTTMRGIHRRPEMGNEHLPLLLLLVVCVAMGLLSAFNAYAAGGAAAQDQGQGPAA